MFNSMLLKCPLDTNFQILVYEWMSLLFRSFVEFMSSWNPCIGGFLCSASFKFTQKKNTNKLHHADDGNLEMEGTQGMKYVWLSCISWRQRQGSDANAMTSWAVNALSYFSFQTLIVLCTQIYDYNPQACSYLHPVKSNIRNVSTIVNTYQLMGVHKCKYYFQHLWTVNSKWSWETKVRLNLPEK